MEFIHKIKPKDIYPVRNDDNASTPSPTTRKELFNQFKTMLDETSFESEEEKKAFEENINLKVRLGAKLTQSEMNYIRKTNPILYVKLLRVQMKREMVEKKLKNCKSKKEVEEVISFEMTCVKDDPDKEMMLKAIDNVVKEYKKTMQYKSLPEETKEDKEKRLNSKSNRTSDNQEEDIEYTISDGEYQKSFIKNQINQLDMKI